MTTNKTTYLALTTGPIYETLQQARSTRALWSASYLFSYFMKNVIDKFRNTHTFLVPYTADDSLFTKPLKCGLFHDRFIFKQNEEGDFKKLQEAVKAEVKSIAENIANDLAENIRNVQDYLLHYLRNCMLKIELEENKNPIREIDLCLDTLELQPVFNPMESRNYLKEFIELKTSKDERSFLVEHAFADLIKNNKKDQIRFDSILEITTEEFSKPLFNKSKAEYWEIYKDNPKKSDKSRFVELDTKYNSGKTDKEKKRLMRYHKYLAVLQADGDNLGELIKQMFEAGTGEISKRFEALSKALFEFDKASMEVIENYGAMPVYVGGDDILCLAPLKNGDKNIFTLVEELDEQFKKTVLKAPGLKDALSKVNPQPSMSYGISISYYKHPMNEALSEAYHLMRNVAKKKKNAVSFRVLKHSGSYFGATFRKPKDNEETLYKNHFLELVNASLGKEGNSFLSSLQYKLNANHGVLEAILHDEMAIENFFENNFNEQVHAQSAFVDTVRDAVKQAWKEFDKEPISQEEKRKQTIATVHAMLRYIQFINQKAKDES